MKKSYFILLLTGIVCTLLSFLILYFCLGYPGDLLLRDALVAVFVGCIFAVPSSIVQIILQKSKILEEEIALVVHIEETLRLLANRLDNSSTALLDFGIAFQNLSGLSCQLGILVENNFLAKSDSVLTLLSNLYSLRNSFYDSYGKNFLNGNFAQLVKACMSDCDIIKKASF